MADWFSNIPLVRILRGEPAPGEQPRPVGKVWLSADYDAAGNRRRERPEPDYGDLSEADAELAAGEPSINWERLDRAIHKAYGDTARQKRLREVAKWSAVQDRERRKKEREERRRAGEAKRQAQQAAIAAIMARRWQDEPACFRFEDGEPTLWVVYLREEAGTLQLYLNNVDRPSQWVHVTGNDQLHGLGGSQTFEWVWDVTGSIPFYSDHWIYEGCNITGDWNNLLTFTRLTQAHTSPDAGPIVPRSYTPTTLGSVLADVTSDYGYITIEGEGRFHPGTATPTFNVVGQSPNPGWVSYPAYTSRVAYQSYEYTAVWRYRANSAGHSVWGGGGVKPWAFYTGGWVQPRSNAWQIEWNDYRKPGTRTWFRTGAAYGYEGRIPTAYFRFDDDLTVCSRWSGPRRNGVLTHPDTSHVAGLRIESEHQSQWGSGYSYTNAAVERSTWEAMGQGAVVVFDGDASNRPDVKARLVSILGWPDENGTTRRRVPCGHPDWDWSSGEFNILGVAFM